MRDYSECIAMYLDPPKPSVLERFPLFGEFVVRGSTAYQFHKWKILKLDARCFYTFGNETDYLSMRGGI